MLLSIFGAVSFTVMFTFEEAMKHFQNASETVGRKKANLFLKDVRSSLPDKPGTRRDIEIDVFDWPSYLANHSEAHKIFESKVIKFSVEVFPEKDPNADKLPNHKHRVDFVCSREDGTAVRLHPHKNGPADPIIIVNSSKPASRASTEKKRQIGDAATVPPGKRIKFVKSTNEASFSRT